MALNMIIFFQAILSAKFCVYGGKIMYTFYTQMAKGWKILDTLFFSQALIAATYLLSIL